jgi:hypothetical protein
VQTDIKSPSIYKVKVIKVYRKRLTTIPDGITINREISTEFFTTFCAYIFPLKLIRKQKFYLEAQMLEYFLPCLSLYLKLMS